MRQPNRPQRRKPQASVAPALNAGLQATTTCVQEAHEAIACKAFDHLLRVPGQWAPTRLVQGVHDAVTQGVYAAVRRGGSAALTLAAGAERLATDPNRIPGVREQLLRSALNGAVGDALAAPANPFRWRGIGTEGPQSFRPCARGSAITAHSVMRWLTLSPLRGRVCVFIHGLACDEGSWGLRTDAWRTSP